ncbi:hypothetical protein GALMADRAFT_224433 [Galerina marginata CBS 339.88]|uniref:MARVEL domain-containing protein n=1 Tax=Galerina marginata (strain CBS 339.88) TaxID=685588 RepID=A0A067T4J4_GALM3|nr:hypothetical protein GALMADRAFT_224433 [Galerina marginata CBS 339.88]
MAIDLPYLRMGLYGVLVVFSFIVLCLTGVRLNYTNHLPRHDSLNSGRDFSDPVVVELLFSTILTIPWSIFVIWSIHRRYENPIFGTFLTEIIGLTVLWIFWVSGAAAATTPWGSLSWCQEFEACRVLSALVAFAWLGWVTITVLLGLSLLFTVANKAMTEPLHGRWNPRESQFVDNVVRA